MSSVGSYLRLGLFIYVSVIWIWWNGLCLSGLGQRNLLVSKCLPLELCIVFAFTALFYIHVWRYNHVNAFLLHLFHKISCLFDLLLAQTMVRTSFLALVIEWHLGLLLEPSYLLFLLDFHTPYRLFTFFCLNYDEFKS